MSTRWRTFLAVAAFAVVIATGIDGLVGHLRHRDPPDVAPPASATAVGSPTPTSSGSAPTGTHSITLGQLHSHRGTEPARVTVSAVHITGPVTAVGTDPRTGLLVVPDTTTTVVWWAYGSRPGQASGPVVLAAHVDYNGKDGIFYPLDHTPIGATVVVTLRNGTTVDYRVDGRQHIVKKRLSSLHIFDTSGPARLVLITCGGSFDAALHSYRDNVVVTARPVT